LDLADTIGDGAAAGAYEKSLSIRACHKSGWQVSGMMPVREN